MIRYLRRVENPDEWDGLFYQGLAQWLASKLSLAIRKEPKQAMGLQELAQNTMAMAMAVDGQENPIQPFVTDNLIWGRD